ncbi:MAG: hypothetical protein ABSG89_12945 [Bacteroidales bacterium]|jgi:hypothetical protein
MKSKVAESLLMALAVCGLMVTECKKESGISTSLPTAQTQQVQNSVAQDAVADKNDQDIDNTLDQLQVSNYSTTAIKSAQVVVSREITVDHPDSTTFPKSITIVYNNFQDSTATESFVKNGEIDVTVSLNSGNKQMVTRTMTFKDYSVTTDSTTVTIRGTRTVQRTALTYKFNGLTSLRLVVTDIITADLSYVITQTGTTDSIKFTRVVSKIRQAFAHYTNLGGLTWASINFKNVPAEDTITYSGTVTGVNEDSEDYTKSIGTSNPLVFIFYKGTPVISSGTMYLTVNSTSTDFTGTGTSPESFLFTYREDPDHPHMTLVTVTNQQTMKTYSFDRRFSRKLVKRW